MRRDENTAGRKMIAARLERMSFWLSCWSSSLRRWEQETLVVSGRPYVRLPPACGCSTGPKVPGLFCQLKCFYSCQKSSTRLVCGAWSLACNYGVVQRSYFKFKDELITFWRLKVIVSRFDLERRIAIVGSLDMGSSPLENPDESEIYFCHPFSVCSWVEAFTVGEFCVSLPDLMRLSTYAFFKRWSRRSDSHSLLCRRARVSARRDALQRSRSAPLTRSCHLSPRSPSDQNVSLRNDAANWSHRKPPSSMRQAAVMSGRGSAD